MAVRIILKSDTGRSAPGESLGRGWGRDFKAGDAVDIGFIPNDGGHPTQGRQGVTELKDLSFWTSCDIDYGLIFGPEDISLLEISSDDYRLAWLLTIWPDGPIEVKPPRWWITEGQP